MSFFCIQEFYISALYIREVWRLSKVLEKGDIGQRILWELGVINVVIVMLDIALLALEYLGFSVLEHVFEGVAYNYKLKMEFAISEKLIDVSGVGQSIDLEAPSNSWGHDFLRVTSVSGDFHGKKKPGLTLEAENVDFV